MDNITANISLTTIKALIRRWADGIDAPNLLIGEREALRELADDHDRIIKSVQNWLADYRREFDESEDDDVVRGLIDALHGRITG